jgi:hypothetical protein
MMVCGAPINFLGLAFNWLHCDFKKADRLSEVRGSVQLVLSRTVLAKLGQHRYLQKAQATHRE